MCVICRKQRCEKHMHILTTFLPTPFSLSARCAQIVLFLPLEFDQTELSLMLTFLCLTFYFEIQEVIK